MVVRMSKNKVIVLKDEEFRKMQLLELDMLVELDKVCRKHNIKYSMFGGTLLGAIRHKGFIPWDDDIDVVMLREEYDKFKKHIDELDSSICYFQDNDTDPEYRWGYGKLRRTNTKFIRVGQEHLKCKTGIFIDVFPLDDIPKSTIGQMINDFRCFCLRKITYSEVGRVSESNSKFKKFIYSLLSKIPLSFVFNKFKKMTKNSNNKSDNLVRTYFYTAIGKLYRKHPLKCRYGMPKKWFLNLSEYTFEGHKFYGCKDYDEVLTFAFGDYMTLPPENKRDPHAPVSSYSFDTTKD